MGFSNSVPCEKCGAKDRMYVQGADNFGHNTVHVNAEDIIECDRCGHIMTGEWYLKARSQQNVSGVVLEVKRGRGRPKKVHTVPDAPTKLVTSVQVVEPKRGRGRPRKNPAIASIIDAPVVKRGRGRPRKNPVA